METKQPNLAKSKRRPQREVTGCDSQGMSNYFPNLQSGKGTGDGEKSICRVTRHGRD